MFHIFGFTLPEKSKTMEENEKSIIEQEELE